MIGRKRSTYEPLGLMTHRAAEKKSWKKIFFNNCSQKKETEWFGRLRWFESNSNWLEYTVEEPPLYKSCLKVKIRGQGSFQGQVFGYLLVKFFRMPENKDEFSDTEFL